MRGNKKNDKELEAGGIMRAQDRVNEIYTKVQKYGTVHVKTLAIEYRVSEDLIRKDLKKLEKEGLLDRVYGGAERKNNKFETSSIHFRLASDGQAKTAIALKAVRCIEPLEYVFLDTSSTSVFIARALGESGKEVTVITDMLEIMQIISEYDALSLIAIGGNFNAYTGGFSGQTAIDQIKSYAVDKAFVSCRSVDIENGYLLEGFVDIGHSKKAILDIARKRYISTQSNKYRSSGVYKFYKLENIDCLITEKALTDTQHDKLKPYELDCL